MNTILAPRRRLSAVRVGLLAGLSVSSFATIAVAQDAQPADDEIVVTGSRIRQDPLAAGRPVMQLGEEDLDRSGLNSVGDFLQRIPASGGGLNSKVNSSGNFGNPPDGGGVGAGSAEIDLRYLGSRRTLVLVDGLRWVNGASASGVPGATDLNTIPSSIIERIEVLQDGASPIYGSDAIAGVINIITKQEQEGFAASAQVGAYDKGDGVSQDYQMTWGTGTDRTRIFFGAQYVHQNSVDSADRSISDYPVATLDQCIGTCSSATPDGRFLFDDPINGFQNLTLADAFQYSGTNPAYPGDFKGFTTADRFNFSPFNYVVTPSERIGFFTQVTHDVSDSVEFRMKALFNNRKSVNQAAPIPLFVGPEGGNGNRMDTIVIDATNPYNPLGFSLDPSVSSYGVFRRLFEAGPRHFKQNVDTHYLSASLSGDLGENWYWDANAFWSRNQADQLGFGIVNSARLEQALGPIANCTGTCVPFNIFGGPGSITQGMLDYITFDQHDTSEQEIWDLQFNLGGDLFNLWAGPLAFAAGFEHRDQSGSFNPDPIVAAGDSADIPAQPTSGGYNVEEMYGEFNLPLINEVGFAKAIDATFAVRHSTYSTGFKTTAIKYGGRWQVTDDFTIRGGFTEGFRAASIGELFGTASRFDQVLVDPCSAPVAPQFAANCSTLGVPGGYTQINAQISVTTGGNPLLGAEESDSWNVGATYAPEWADDTFLKGFVLDVNYYDIEITGAIQALDAQLQLDGCVSTLDPALCGGITRLSTGTISSFSNRLTNIGGINTRGLDWSARFTIPLGGADLGVNWMATRLFDYTELTPTSTGFLEISREGRLRGSPQLAFPRLKSSLTADLDFGGVNFRSTWRYVSGLREQCRGFTAIQAIPDARGCSSYNAADDNLSTNSLKPKLYMDVSASFDVTENIEFSLGVNNVLDTDPPPCFSCQLNGFDPNTYDAPGQFGYVRLVWRP